MRADGPVVIGLDGSGRSRTTLTWGLDEAERRGTSAVLARAYLEPFEYAAGWYPAMGDPGSMDEVKEYLTDEAEREGRRRPGLLITTQMLHGGAVPELRTLTEDAQLLVVGAGVPAARPRLGAVAAHLAAHGHCPVAVVRRAPEEGLIPDLPVVVGVDGSAVSVRAAHVAAQTARRRGVELRVVHAKHLAPAPFVRRADEPRPTGPHRAVCTLTDELRALHPGLQVRLLVVADDPGRALVDASRSAQLVVVGSRGLGALRGMLLGSVSNHVSRAAFSTVLVVHEDD